MSEFVRPGVAPRLRLERAGEGIRSVFRQQEEEEYVLASVARVLEDVRANGCVLGEHSTRLTLAELRQFVRSVAMSGWGEKELPGESPVPPLHREHNDWGPPLDARSDLRDVDVKEPRLPRRVLAVDVLDFLACLMGSADTLVWEDGSS